MIYENATLWNVLFFLFGTVKYCKTELKFNITTSHICSDIKKVLRQMIKETNGNWILFYKIVLLINTRNSQRLGRADEIDAKRRTCSIKKINRHVLWYNSSGSVIWFSLPKSLGRIPNLCIVYFQSCVVMHSTGTGYVKSLCQATSPVVWHTKLRSFMMSVLSCKSQQ